ncbi:MAG TPA: hypothetical protein VGZ05_03070 [Steroidobacteraceae bacterium]|jgi:hypothetical protein|nr:hypothetical protein [Steroidobacteraceae bacterium]
MLMPDSVLAAIIAGSATLSASLLQLRSALLREAAARSSSSASRRKSRVQLILVLVIAGAAAVSGFALSQWLTNGERAAQGVMQRELQARVAEISRTASQLELTRGSERAEIESGVLRRIGTDGVVVMATVPACRPGLGVSASGAAAPAALTADVAPTQASSHTCTEAEASPVTLCASIPGNATVSEIALFSRPADSDASWSASRFLPGQESGQARFAEKYSEGAPAEGVRQVCQGFAHWSAEHARVVRVIVRYSLQA